MTSRHVKLTCESCGAIWRTARVHIARARGAGTLRCGFCDSTAAPAVGDEKLSDEERAQLHAVCESVIDVRDINEERARRLAEIQRRRAHGLSMQRRVHGEGSQ